MSDYIEVDAERFNAAVQQILKSVAGLKLEEGAAVYAEALGIVAAGIAQNAVHREPSVDLALEVVDSIADTARSVAREKFGSVRRQDAIAKARGFHHD